MLHIVRSGRSGSARAHHTVTSIAAAMLAAVLLCALAPPEAARAGEYDVYACAYPDGRTAPADGWRQVLGGGGFEYTSGGCDSRGGLIAFLDPEVTHGTGSFAGWRVDAPDDLQIVAFRGESNYDVGEPGSGGTPAISVASSSATLRYCHRLNGCTSRVRAADAWRFAGSSSLQFSAACDGSGNCTPQNPKAGIGYYRPVITLHDGLAPSASGVAGGLAEATVLNGAQSVDFNAADRGGGVKDTAVVVDGDLTGWRLIDANGGRCSPEGGWYADRVPCRLSAPASASLDTAKYGDGSHSVRVVLRDAANNQTTVVGPRTVTFDNNAPSMADPSVSGRAEEGQTLTCSAQSLSGQSPKLDFAWIRSRADGSGGTTIAGVDTSSYVLTKDDVDRKVRCSITATDGGGSTTRTSGLSSGPFADGATVKAAPAAPPSNQPPATTTTQPGSGTPTTPTGPGGDQTTVNVAGSSSSSSTTTTTPAAGTPRTGAKLTAVFASTGQAIAGALHGRTVTIRGQLDDRDGAPIPGGLLELVARADVPNAPERPVATARSRGDGTFGLAFAARLPTSELVLRHKAAPGGATLATTTLDLRVAAGLTLNATKRVRPRGLIRFTGRLLTGPVPRRGKVIELRARGGNGKWILFKTVRTNAAGTFRASYRLRRGFRNITYQFQAVARAESGYPYTAGASPVRRTRVR